MSVRWKWGCRTGFRESFSVSATSTMGGRNRLCTAQSAQERAVIAAERPSWGSAEGSKQGIDQLLLYYACSHGFLHANFQSVIKFLYQLTVLVYGAVIQSKVLCNSLKLQGSCGNKGLPAVTLSRMKILAFFCLPWLCDAFSQCYEDGLLWFHAVLLTRNHITGLCCLFLLFFL